LIPEPIGALTHAITIGRPTREVWPWLVQMGAGSRAGWYSYDFLDNAGIESAREIHPELQRIEVGETLPATPEGDDGFEVLRVEPPRVLILGGLFDPVADSQLSFASPRPERSGPRFSKRAGSDRTPINTLVARRSSKRNSSSACHTSSGGAAMSIEVALPDVAPGTKSEAVRIHGS
jgi:hypothetical protein